MDNQTIDVCSEGDEGILNALAIIWKNACPGGKAKYYTITKLSEHTRYYLTEDNRLESNVYQHTSHAHHFTELKENPNGIETLILLWYTELKLTKFDNPLNIKEAAVFIRDWLKTVDYGREPDHDGDNGRGWRLFTESWGHVAGHHGAIIAAQPAWAMYGK